MPAKMSWPRSTGVPGTIPAGWGDWRAFCMSGSSGGDVAPNDLLRKCDLGGGSVIGGGSVNEAVACRRRAALSEPSEPAGGALDASRRVGDARCSIVWPSRNLPLLTDLPAQSRDQLASSLSAQVELGGHAGVRRRVHKAVDVDFDVLGGPCFCAPGFLESEQVLDALRGASAHRVPAPALKWGQAALITHYRMPAPIAIFPPPSALRCAPVSSDAGHERPESNLVPGIAIRSREPAGNYSAVNIEQNKTEKAVDAVRDRSASRVVKARRAGGEMEERTQVYNVPTSEVEGSSACHRNIRREQNIRSISQRSLQLNCAFSVNFALIRLKHDRQYAILSHKGRPGLLIYRGEKRYCRFKRSNVEVLAGCGQAATASNPIRFATLSNPLPILNERACNG